MMSLSLLDRPSASLCRKRGNRLSSGAAIILALCFAGNATYGQTNENPPPPHVQIDASQCTKIGKYHHCLLPPTMLAISDEQFKALSETAPTAHLDISRCAGGNKIGPFHYCPLAPPTAIDLTDEQLNALTAK
jgi:hypothetical protein